MSEPHSTTKSTATPTVQGEDPHFSGGAEQVLQVERRDYTSLAPTSRPRRQRMRGFDPVYTDIVDYIVRCTHRIWDERDVGLIYTHYTHNAAVYYPLGAVHSREDMVRDTIQRLVTFPERRGMATQVIWRGNDIDGFYTSHLVTSTGRHTQHGHFGPPTGRTFTSRTVADCMVLENRIYREWIVADNMAFVRQLGLDADAIAEGRAREMLARGAETVEIGENLRLLGQYPPETEPDLAIAHTDMEAECLRWLHEIYNKRMFGKIREVYAPNVQWHGPLMKEMYGRAAVLHQVMSLVGTIPDCAFMPQHICSVPSEEGGVKIAVRWVLDGHHLGYGALGAPTGHRVVVMGISHLHVRDGRIVDEWTVYDELATRIQIKLGELAQQAKTAGAA